MSGKKKTIFGLILLVLIAAGLYIHSRNNPTPPRKADETLIRAKADEVLAALKDNDIEAFKNLVHPEEGVVFSKDGVVLPDDQRLTREAIADLVGSDEEIFWGYADGSGLHINETLSEHLAKYSQKNYLNAPQIAHDLALRGGANTVNNISTTYEGKNFVSYHFPYTVTYVDDSGEEVGNELSWASLNLIFGEYKNDYYLIAIVEDGWTT